MRMKSSISIKWEFEQFHRWANAPEQVAFLRNLHRHIFKCQLTLDVLHDDRELEFFIVRNRILKEINIDAYMKDSEHKLSCEAIAKIFLSHIETWYPNRDIKLEVFEDGENGAVLELIA